MKGYKENNLPPSEGEGRVVIGPETKCIHMLLCGNYNTEVIGVPVTGKKGVSRILVARNNKISLI